ncbi:MAG: IclR family transcriptional regulator [Acidimicrobiia bacterium]|nr:IclR family transcriptional regulator [Acidimicrobiia bacterium]
MSGVQSVERAFAILQCLAGGEAGVSEIADQVDLPKSTVARLLATLVDVGAAEQRSAGGSYALGELVIDLAAGAVPSRNLVGIAHPHLLELVETLDETAGLSVLDTDGQVLYLDQVEADNPVAIRDWTGQRLPFHCVASGLVMASRTRDPALLAQPLPALTDRTVTEPALVEQRLEEARLQGVAWTVDELADDISAVAAPVMGPGGAAVAAIHVHGPSYRFPGERRRGDIEPLVRGAAERVSALLTH